MTPVGGGVQHRAAEGPASRATCSRTSKGAVKHARAKVKLDGLAKGQWWWD